MVPLSQTLRELGCRDVAFITDRALNLHDCQYHGPDPNMALSNYHTREEATRAVVELVSAVVNYVEKLRDKCGGCEQLLGEPREELAK